MSLCTVFCCCLLYNVLFCSCCIILARDKFHYGTMKYIWLKLKLFRLVSKARAEIIKSTSFIQQNNQSISASSFSSSYIIFNWTSLGLRQLATIRVHLNCDVHPFNHFLIIYFHELQLPSIIFNTNMKYNSNALKSSYIKMKSKYQKV